MDAAGHRASCGRNDLGGCRRPQFVVVAADEEPARFRVVCDIAELQCVTFPHRSGQRQPALGGRAHRASPAVGPHHTLPALTATPGGDTAMQHNGWLCAMITAAEFHCNACLTISRGNTLAPSIVPRNNSSKWISPWRLSK